MPNLPPPPDLGLVTKDGTESPATHAFDLSSLERLLNASNDKLEVFVINFHCKYGATKNLRLLTPSPRHSLAWCDGAIQHMPRLLNYSKVSLHPQSFLCRASCKTNSSCLA